MSNEVYVCMSFCEFKENTRCNNTWQSVCVLPILDRHRERQSDGQYPGWDQVSAASSRDDRRIECFPLSNSITHHLLHPRFPLSPSFPLSLLFVCSIHLFPSLYLLSCLIFSLLLCLSFSFFLLICLILTLFFPVFLCHSICLKDGCTGLWGLA